MAADSDLLFLQAETPFPFQDFGHALDLDEFEKAFFPENGLEDIGTDDFMAELQDRDFFKSVYCNKQSEEASPEAKIENNSALFISTVQPSLTSVSAVESGTRSFSCSQAQLQPSFKSPQAKARHLAGNGCFVGGNPSIKQNGFAAPAMKQNGFSAQTIKQHNGFIAASLAALKQNGLTIPADELNCLSLDQHLAHQTSLSSASCTSPLAEKYALTVNVCPSPHTKRSSSSLTSPTNKQAHVGGLESPRYVSTNVSEAINSLVSCNRGMNSSSVNMAMSSICEDLSMANSVDRKEGIVYASNAEASCSSNVLEPVESFLSEVDSNGDCLRPLVQISRPFSSLQKSFSSHALGQLQTLAPPSEHSRAHYSGQPLDQPDHHLGSMNPQLHQQLPSIQAKPQSLGMRRVCSTGDIQRMNSLQTLTGGTSPLPSDNTCEDGGFRIGRYSAEERKIRIHRYRQKRTERNFNKKIKYACRKTLADSRPRVRGRFAKNEDVQDVNKHRSEEYDEEVDTMFEEDEGFLLDQLDLWRRPISGR